MKDRLKGIPLDKPVEVNWYQDWGVMTPHCPRCDELAYEEDECVFCHQKLIYTPKPKGYEDLVVEYKNYRATQVHGSWGLYIEKDGKLLMHASCSRAFTKEELLEKLKFMAEHDEEHKEHYDKARTNKRNSKG